MENLLQVANPRKETIIFSFGCPRSGTTFIRSLLLGIPGFEYEKIREGDLIHPCRSDNGLIGLTELFRGRNVIFIRSVRSSHDIFESFYTARKFRDQHHEMAHLAEYDDAAIFSYIDTEKKNFEHNRRLYADLLRRWSADDVTGYRFDIIEFDYDRMNEESCRLDFLEELKTYLPPPLHCILDQISDRFQSFGDPTKSVRLGRLAYEIHGTLLSPELRAEITNHYSHRNADCLQSSQ